MGANTTNLRLHHRHQRLHLATVASFLFSNCSPPGYIRRASVFFYKLNGVALHPGVSNLKKKCLATMSCKAKAKRRKRDNDVVWAALRQAQRKCGCNHKTLETIMQTVEPFLQDGATDGATVLQLNGCVGCNNHVFLHTSKRIRCPKCNHPRFNREKKPNEVFWYFPLKQQLKPLLQNQQYRQLLMWETRRGRHPGFMSDVYDSPR